jgi:quercetin dioxygenase-like cupin family protein
MRRVASAAIAAVGLASLSVMAMANMTKSDQQGVSVIRAGAGLSSEAIRWVRQTLIVTRGHGFVQEWQRAAQAIGPGDVVWIPPGVKHWHGASAREAMTHVAIVESENNNSVTWMEKVSDAQYADAVRGHPR